MFARKFIIFNLIVHVIIVFSYVDVVHARCIRIPEGSGARRSPSTGNFRIRFSDDSGVYKPGKQYTIYLERTNSGVRSRDRPRPSFIGFFLAVEQKTNMTSSLIEDYSPIKHGILKPNPDNTLIRLSDCGNVITHTSETAKNEIAVNWTAPEPGSGCVTFRATVIEHRDVWYMDDGPLSKDFCEDEDTQDDYITNILDECGACSEAKYELTFEGLWSRNTHPKDFPRNVYTTKFGDIIGATHNNDDGGFWANGKAASPGLKEVAETGSTRKLEDEMKQRSDSIRTIIKARGLSYPNITGKTFAVFRVDPAHHLVSFVSNISPSPDWFVGVSALELCQPEGTWLESKIVDLYPWDAGTDRGVTYDAPDQPAYPPEYIRRITSESPNNIDSPFYSPNGSKMKPLARLTLLRQRLYEKNCTAEQSASDDCQVGEYSAWGECTGAVCGGTGKQYRQRYYKNPDKATKCHRKLFETKTCIMPRCTHENVENEQYDPECDNRYFYSEWSSCRSRSTKRNCKNSDYEKGVKIKKVQWQREYQKKCALRSRLEDLEEECELNWCSGGRNQFQEPNLETDVTDTEVTTETVDDETTTKKPTLDCASIPRKKSYSSCTRCEGLCGTGKRTCTYDSMNKDCEPTILEVDCPLPACKNSDFCATPPDPMNCQQDEMSSNYIFYNATICTCTVFNTDCKKESLLPNIFSSFDECMTKCPEDSDNCSYRNRIKYSRN